VGLLHSDILIKTLAKHQVQGNHSDLFSVSSKMEMKSRCERCPSYSRKKSRRMEKDSVQTWFKKIIKVLSGLRMGLRGGVRPRIVTQAQSINKQLLLPFKASRNS
jgi:hypothetical protein